MSEQAMIDPAIGRRIGGARVMTGKTPRQLADELGWEVSKLYRIERGAQLPSAAEIIHLARAVGRTVDWLLNGDQA